MRKQGVPSLRGLNLLLAGSTSTNRLTRPEKGRPRMPRYRWRKKGPRLYQMRTKPPGLGVPSAYPGLPVSRATPLDVSPRPLPFPVSGRLQANGIQEADGSIPFSSTKNFNDLGSDPLLRSFGSPTCRR